MFARITLIPDAYLWPAVFILSVVGAYAPNQSMVDVLIMLVFGVVGFLFRRYGFSPAPLIMGLVLGKMVEETLKQSLLIFDQDWLLFFARPVVVSAVRDHRRGPAGAALVRAWRRQRAFLWERPREPQHRDPQIRLMPHIPASEALSRFRVIDLTQVRAGPTAARQLADWGADVIQVQMPEHMRGDDTLGGQDGSDYQYTHRNKRSITLNLKEPEGIAALKRLVETADVLVENFRPDVKFRLGIDYETLAKINPRLVYASISGFGQTGPYATRPGFDQIAQGMGGLMSVTGLAGPRPAARRASRSPTCAAGIFAAYGVTVALLEREASGKGQWVHTSLLRGDGLHDGFPDLALDRSTARSRRRPATSTRPASPPASTRRSDGYMNIAVFGCKIWERFCRGHRRARVDHRRALHDKASRSREPRLAQRRDRAGACAQRPATTGSRSSTRRRRLRAHQRHERGVRRAAGASTSAW